MKISLSCLKPKLPISLHFVIKLASYPRGVIAKANWIIAEVQRPPIKTIPLAQLLSPQILKLLRDLFSRELDQHGGEGARSQRWGSEWEAWARFYRSFSQLIAHNHVTHFYFRRLWPKSAYREFRYLFHEAEWWGTKVIFSWKHLFWLLLWLESE